LSTGLDRSTGCRDLLLLGALNNREELLLASWCLSAATERGLHWTKFSEI